MPRTKRQTPPPPPPRQPDPDYEPQPHIGGHDPWRELSPEHEEVLKRQREDYDAQHLEFCDLVAEVLGQGRGPELLDLLRKSARAHPRSSYEEVLRRDAKLEMVEHLEDQIEKSRER